MNRSVKKVYISKNCMPGRNNLAEGQMSPLAFRPACNRDLAKEESEREIGSLSGKNGHTGPRSGETLKRIWRREEIKAK
jgi:hypothetical protein